MNEDDKTILLPAALSKALLAEQTPKAVGKRARLVREFLELDQAEFIEPVGIKQPVYSNYERGKYMLRAEVAIALCNFPPYQQRTGLTTDYLYRGDDQLLRRKFTDWLRENA